MEHLRKQAKDLLKAQRSGNASAARPLGHLSRFADASDADVLGAHVTLHEAQLAVAMEYGFKTWQALRSHVRARQRSAEATIDAVRLRCAHEIPQYAAAGVPLGVVAALNHAGEDIDYMDFAAATGWAFSFGYQYGDISPAFLAVEGNPRADGPFEVFAWLPRRLGYGYEMAPTREPEKLWPFVVKHVDAGTPVMSEHLDGGLIRGYRQEQGRRQVYFDGTVGAGWTNVADLHPFGVYVLVRQSDPLAPEQLARGALKRAVAKGRSHEADGVPHGMAALEAYLGDVADPDKDFADCQEWFCWAAFERLMARRCCEVWLGKTAASLPGPVGGLVREAARHYGDAHRHYEQYRSAVSAGEPTPVALRERARSRERIERICPLLRRGIGAEREGLAALGRAVGRLG
jgi:hypothetical protein